MGCVSEALLLWIHMGSHLPLCVPDFLFVLLQSSLTSFHSRFLLLHTVANSECGPKCFEGGKRGKHTLSGSDDHVIQGEGIISPFNWFIPLDVLCPTVDAIRLQEIKVFTEPGSSICTAPRQHYSGRTNEARHASDLCSGKRRCVLYRPGKQKSVLHPPGKQRCVLHPPGKRRCVLQVLES